MNKPTKLLLLFLAVMISFASCRENEVFLEKEIIPLGPEVFVFASVGGTVKDENNEAISNADVTIGSIITQTDENGSFFIQEVEVNERGSFIKVYKEGYFHNSSFITSKLNGENRINLVLIKKELSGSFESPNGGTITLLDGAEIVFPSNGLIDNNGNSYSGKVNVYAKWLDPTSPDLVKIMPGDLRAIDQDQIQKQLTTFGMIGVEIEDENGAQLNIKNGEMATISLPIPQSILSDAPSEIPLWHFDESTGYWNEEGSANLQGGKYVGEVGHFSFWNCDIPSSVIFLDGLIMNRNVLVGGVVVKITTAIGGATGVGYTDAEGYFGGYVPIGEVLNISICDACGEVVYSEEIGPFEDDTTLPGIDIILDESQFVTITGSLVSCDLEPVQNGYVSVFYEYFDSIFVADENGIFNGSILACDDQVFNIVGYDDSNNFSETQSFSINGLDVVDVGQLVACGEMEEYFSYFIDGNFFSMTGPDLRAYFDMGFIDIEGADNSGQNEVCYFTVTGFDDVGIYPISIFGAQGIIDGQLVKLECINCTDIIVDISKAGTSGDFVVGTFGGEVIDDASSIKHLVSGSFAIKIE